jgi:hypothetical protein
MQISPGGGEVRRFGYGHKPGKIQFPPQRRSTMAFLARLRQEPVNTQAALRNWLTEPPSA